MKINSKIINIPPFISTSWDNIASIHMKGGTLALVLSNNETILVPGLAPSTVELIFAAHAAHLEEKGDKHHFASGNLLMQAFSGEESKEFPLKFGFSTVDGVGAALQHDPSQHDAPPVPEEILKKIAAIAKIVTQDELVDFPKGEPDCNCMHCQICRAISENSSEMALPRTEEPPVSEEELRFQDWEIVQTADKLYQVINPLDREEKYNVFLGEPVGCTCGKQGCEHILAVLKS